MSDDWKPGDYALCVKDHDDGELPVVRSGECRRVADVIIGQKVATREEAVCLDLVGCVHTRYAYPARKFIKITPSAELVESERIEEVPA